MTQQRTLCFLNPLLLLALGAVSIPGQPAPTAGAVPVIRGQTLEGKEITLPEAASGRAILLLIGLSKKAGDRTKPWKERYLADSGTDPSYYEVAMLDAAPSMLRGMIRSSMRGGTPAAQRAHVVTSTSGSSAWRKYFEVTDDSLPLIVVLDGSGHAGWSYKGEFDEKRYGELKAAIADARKKE